MLKNTILEIVASGVLMKEKGLPDSIAEMLAGEGIFLLSEQPDGRCAVIEISMWNDSREAAEYVHYSGPNGWLDFVSPTVH